MIINGIDGNFKSALLAQKVVDLLLSEVSSEKILVLTLNSFKKEKILSLINEKLFDKKSAGYSQINVSTFAGITYNSVLKNWTAIEKLLAKSGGNNEILPLLSGLDASQYFFKEIIKEEDFKDYFSKKNLMHQLLRRYKLIVENSLTEIEIQQKSQILNESFAKNAHCAINDYKSTSSKNRIFDNLKQISSFMFLLKNNLIKDFDKVEYFFAEDADEYNYAAFEFCKFMIEKSKEHFIFLDKNGCSRKGYLCGYSEVYNDLKASKDEEKILSSSSKLKNDAENLFKNITENANLKLKNFELHSYSKRLEEIEAAAQKILELLKNGTKINKIQIITPLVDENLIYPLNEFFKGHNIKLQLLTGNQKITKDIYVNAILTVLQLLNPAWQMKPNSFDIRILLNEILQIPIFECKEFISYFEKCGILAAKNDTKYHFYNVLSEILNDEELKHKKISEQFEKIFAALIAPNMYSCNDFEPTNLLLKSINEFEKIQENFKTLEQIDLTPKDWLLHIKNSIVSQNPSMPAHIDKNALIISTAQKIADFSLDSDYQIWLDISSSEWVKEDTGTIYNSWVFQKNFVQDEFNCELNHKLTLEKTARLLRKLTLCAKEKIFAYTSVYDVSGYENLGGAADFIEIEEEKIEEFNFIPRDDQKEILQYSGGRMAVPAVPGAGKTTVMLALLLQLVKQNVNPSQILVLTYMESAARNFLNRFKKITLRKTAIPQISTIHAFAYKMIMENNNYALLNLPDDFSICDDALKTLIVKEICSYKLPIGENLEDWTTLMLTAISKSKLSQIPLENLHKEAIKDVHLQEFLNIFNTYNQKIKEASLVDYDDLLLYGVRLLEENQELATFYQEKFKFIIEDEAQDSSAIQQKLINILSTKNNNVIRCGDVNQAILGTFSNSDVKGFKEFIAKNHKVEMFRSQRCAKGIYSLANALIDYSKTSPVMKEAFYDLKMAGVEGKNPTCENSAKYNIAATQEEERTNILKDISEKLKENDKPPSFAILLRTNRQVSEWAAFIEKNGLKVLCRGDNYRQKEVFNFILSALELFLTPWNNKIVAEFYRNYCNICKLKFDNELYKYLKKNKNTVLHPDFLKKSNIKNAEAVNFWWEAFSIAENHTLDVQEIVIGCANRYFTDITDKSNAYLFSVLIKRYTNSLSADEHFSLNHIPDVIKYFKNLLAQKTLKGINLFSKEDEDDSLNGFVQIMTAHKAKGAEFDYVYIPEFNDYNYSLNFVKCAERIKKRKKPLLSKLDKIASGKEISISETAKEEINETLRLIYVAVTRAKKGLSFSYSSKNRFNKENSPCEIVEEIFSNMLSTL